MRVVGEPKKSYRELANVFENWFLKKKEEIKACKNLDSPPAETLNSLNLSEEEYYKIYIEPYQKLSKKDLQTTFKVLAPNLIQNFTGENIPIAGELKIIFDVSFQRKENALDWLLFQVYNIGLFPLSERLEKLLDEPYKQCFYCGKPNSYKRGHQDVKFNNKVIYCHKPKCQKSSNPEKHDDCCYARWTRRRKTLEDALKKADTLYQDIDEFENYKLSENQEIILLNKIEKIFIDFCEKQYQENLKIDYTIQTEDMKAICLKEIPL